jgi:hypothetical protein
MAAAETFVFVFDKHYNCTGRNSRDLFLEVVAVLPETCERLMARNPAPRDYLIALSLLRHAPRQSVHANSWGLSKGKTMDVVWKVLASLSQIG